ncbi:hypothetical protein TWF481_000194 [Arthrobotrys musiformis]|uniref:Uncharacterized protein n=1 Tax=Arthrobotrys musiformis TaxID=47236 RepID=A0AAV9WNP0_9PEZI
MPFLVDLTAFCARHRKMGKPAVLKKFKQHLYQAGQVHSLLELRKQNHGRYGKVIAAMWPDNPASRKKKVGQGLTRRSEVKGIPKHVGITTRRKNRKRRSRGAGARMAPVSAFGVIDPIILELSEEMAKLVLEDEDDFMELCMDF